MQSIRQYQPAFGVGVDHLDCLASHRGHDVTRTLRVAIRHILDKSDHTHDITRHLARRNRHHRARDGGGTAHVELHVLHALGRLQRDAAGIKGNPLANKRQWILVSTAAPVHDDHP